MKNVKMRFPLVISGTLALAMLFSVSCSDDEDPPLPPIGGYNNSDEVASANSVAKWSFDGTNNEVKSSTAPTTTVVIAKIGVPTQVL